MSKSTEIEYLLQSEPGISKKFDFFSFWLYCCSSGTIICYINTTIWHVILGTDIDDKITFSLQYIGLISCVLYSLSMTFIFLEFQPENILTWYIISCITWGVNYNCYIIMFFKQTSIWFGLYYRYISFALIIIINVFIFADFYYYIATLLIATEEVIYIGHTLDFAVTTGLSVIELVYNIITINKIVKEAIKSNNPHTRTLIIKLTSVIGIFLFSDIAISLMYALIDESYALTICVFFVALKLQSEYFCLNRIKQCLIIMNTYDSVHVNSSGVEN
jgi:hypothetical protein